MNMYRKFWSIIFVTFMLLIAVGITAQDTDQEMDETLPKWQVLPLTNATTGEEFSLADFAGKTVFVEPMATWCSNCRQQLTNVISAVETLDSDDYVFIALSLETNLSDEDLAAYAEARGFDWTFAVMSEDILRELADEFGRSIGNAPSTPHFIIRPDSTFTDLHTGIDSADDIVEMVLRAEEEGPAPMTDDEMAEEVMVPQVERPEWHSLELTDANTGEIFTFADFAGKTMFIEPMATWCSNCRQQLTNVRAARESLDSDDYVFIALSVETNLSNEDLAAYTAREGFDWTFAVITEDLLRALADEFGRSIANPPATPHFIIRPDGSYTDLFTGIDPIDDIIQTLTAESEMAS